MKPPPLHQIYDRLRLLPYQSAFAANTSRFKIGLWARQTGKDHTAALEAVIDCLFHPGTTWIILAASERQALETLSKAKEWAEILRFRIHDYDEERVSPVARLQSAEIRWANGSRLMALATRPETMRGYSGNLILTEFAFHENADAIWRAIFPSISNPLRGGLKKVRIISTPNGLTNKFANLWFNGPNVVAAPRESAPLLNPGCGRGHETLIDSAIRSSPSPPVRNSFGYFKSKVTIHDAIAAGLPMDAAELEAGLNDPDAWAQEYLCEFMDTSSVLFPYDLISPCESEQATESGVNLPELPAARRGHLFAGIDFGRKNNLTVCWILEKIPTPIADLSGNPNLAIRHPQYITREVLTLKNTSTPDQLELLLPRLRHCWRICLDATGAGVGLGDYLVRQFGEYAWSGSGRPTKGGNVELCQFTNALKGQLFPRLRTAFEQRALRIPISREIREDLHAVQKMVSLTGQISYRAPQSADGHSDRTTALALALRAATNAPVSCMATTVWVPRERRWSARRRRIVI